ncbi:hypothetical protein M9H77_07660 [Catharanthus roseus]|uniref:Uncharacterized protein n=1 Tax=Catharanthus roseus TaxID=4058 RepID=A0ACC0BVR9_CATRO|nr:hypothetical protein M9H77_07660 [Catharanthus roseus]
MEVFKKYEFFYRNRSYGNESMLERGLMTRSDIVDRDMDRKNGDEDLVLKLDGYGEFGSDDSEEATRECEYLIERHENSKQRYEFKDNFTLKERTSLGERILGQDWTPKKSKGVHILYSLLLSKSQRSQFKNMGGHPKAEEDLEFRPRLQS